MMADLLDIAEREALTQALAVPISVLTGRYPKVNRYPERNVIELYPDQIEKAQGYINDWLDKKPGAVQIDIKPVIIPVILKRYWPWLAGGSAIMVLLGLMIGRTISK